MLSSLAGFDLTVQFLLHIRGQARSRGRRRRGFLRSQRVHARQQENHERDNPPDAAMCHDGAMPGHEPCPNQLGGDAGGAAGLLLNTYLTG